MVSDAVLTSDYVTITKQDDRLVAIYRRDDVEEVYDLVIPPSFQGIWKNAKLDIKDEHGLYHCQEGAALLYDYGQGYWRAEWIIHGLCYYEAGEDDAEGNWHIDHTVCSEPVYDPSFFVDHTDD